LRDITTQLLNQDAPMLHFSKCHNHLLTYKYSLLQLSVSALNHYNVLN